MTEVEREHEKWDKYKEFKQKIYYIGLSDEQWNIIIDALCDALEIE